MAEEIRVAVVDNYPLFREGVVRAFRRDKNIVVVAEGATAEEAERFAQTKKLDVLLIEVAVPRSLQTAEAILRMCKSVKVVFFAAVENEDHITSALRAGVHGYIMKGITGHELIRAIKAVQKNERYITSDLAWRLVATPALVSSHQDAGDRRLLTLREQQVLECSSRGLTNPEIASALGVKISTVKFYKTRAYRKIGVRNRVEAIGFAG